MIQNVSAITVNGGGDCPELAADGIIHGMLIINIIILSVRMSFNRNKFLIWHRIRKDYIALMHYA